MYIEVFWLEMLPYLSNLVFFNNSCINIHDINFVTNMILVFPLHSSCEHYFCKITLQSTSLDPIQVVRCECAGALPLWVRSYAIESLYCHVYIVVTISLYVYVVEPNSTSIVNGTYSRLNICQPITNREYSSSQTSQTIPFITLHPSLLITFCPTPIWFPTLTSHRPIWPSFTTLIPPLGCYYKMCALRMHVGLK